MPSSDVLCAEVQKVHESGEIVLQTRSAKYGKLHNGLMVQVPAALVRRQQAHIVNVAQVEVFLILGNNGWIWIGDQPKISGGIQSLNFSQMDVGYTQVDRRKRDNIAYVRSCVDCLAKCWLEITVDNILKVFATAKELNLESKDLCSDDVVFRVVQPVIDSLKE